ncbi:hypothetical protein [Actinacidiphila oryziradicis]|uniref:Extensin n=1 Tax=Actinacidiphila oryziradicis TaxID=2571141 RepID=A0A4U0SU57_9ACTN|nr:hypothetical protein [Actinacidiphila oryziradicis]TKA11597.1 hypothetical protein FCI23_09585 [Actinacidiphila oryziradicis]
MPASGPTVLGAAAGAAARPALMHGAGVGPDSTAPQGDAPVQRSTDGLRFSGVAQAFPAVQRSSVPAPGIPSVPREPRAQGRDLPVPLAVAAPAPPMALPVQRTPATPSLMNRMRAFVSPARLAEPQVTPAVVHSRTSAGNGGGKDGGKDGGGGGGGTQPPAYSEHNFDSPPAYSAQRPPNNTGHGITAQFDARELKDGQIDELTHRLIGPLTRLLRTELRHDRERIGRLRDPRR